MLTVRSLPVVFAAVLLAYLHRRNVKKLRAEDKDDKYKSLDFGIDPAITNKGKKGPEMKLWNPISRALTCSRLACTARANLSTRSPAPQRTHTTPTAQCLSETMPASAAVAALTVMATDQSTRPQPTPVTR
jgi:hypothetical protein